MIRRWLEVVALALVLAAVGGVGYALGYRQGWDDVACVPVVPGLFQGPALREVRLAP